MACVVDAADRFVVNRIYPRWFTSLIGTFGRIVYHEDVSENFEIVEDGHRFAEGWSFLCKNCNAVANQRYDYAPESKTWFLAKIKCRCGCGRRWESEELEPIYHVIFTNWEESDVGEASS